ncbi:porin [Persicobacter diffluens]
MKKPLFIALLLPLFYCGMASAQEAEVQEEEIIYFEEEEKESKNALANVFKRRHNGYILMQSSFNVNNGPGFAQGSNFSINQLRVQLTGEILPGLEYDVRQRLNSNSVAEEIDNTSLATDWAYLTYTFKNNVFITFGKQWAAYGGYEFDATPTDIYEYSQILNWKEAFLTGVNVGYRWQAQEVNFQVTNAHTESIESFYGELPEDFIAAENPMNYAFNWNGDLLKGLFSTRWSYAVTNEGKEEYTKYLALGTKFNQPKWQITVDYHNSKEDIDRTGFATSIVRDMNDGEHAALRDTHYKSTLAKIDVQPHKGWNLFYQYSHEDVFAHDTSLGENAGWLETANRHYFGVEYQPFEEQPLKLFCTYWSNTEKYNDYFETSQINNNRMMIGFQYKWQFY